MYEFDLTTEAGILDYLRQGPFPTSQGVTRLTGGFSAFVYRVQTGELQSGASSFVVKHVTSHAAKVPQLQLAQYRLVSRERHAARNVY